MAKSKAVKKTVAKKATVKSPAKKTAVVKVAAPKADKPVKAKEAAPAVANSTAFEIKKAGTYNYQSASLRATGHSSYPFASLDVEDGFFIPASVDTSKIVSAEEATQVQREALAKVANRMSGAVRRFGKHNADKKFSVTMVTSEEEGFGVLVKRTA